jgi:hypothetical protein
MMRKLSAFSPAMKHDARAYVRSVLAITLLRFATVCYAGDLATVEERLVCGNTEVRVFTTCGSKPEADFFMECTEQHFLFADRDGKVLARVRGSGQLRQRLRDDGKDMGTWLNGLAVDWACLRGRNSSVVLISYSSRGNCSGCEWDEILDLKGHRLASSEVPPRVKEKEEERIGKAFDKTYDALGLPMPWPYSLFQRIRAFEHPYSYTRD